MPTSDLKHISKIMDLIRNLNPKSILDIGPGFGKYGFLCREYLEIWNRKTYHKKDWKTRIDAIEVFPKYVTPVHKYIYNNIYIGNAYKLISELKFKYELVLLIDVLEHFDKRKGEQLIERLKECSKYILISIPKKIGNQGTEFNNKFEQHKGQWTKKELIEIGAKQFLKDKNKFICLIK